MGESGPACGWKQRHKKSVLTTEVVQLGYHMLWGAPPTRGMVGYVVPGNPEAFATLAGDLGIVEISLSTRNGPYISVQSGV